MTGKKNAHDGNACRRHKAALCEIHSAGDRPEKAEPRGDAQGLEDARHRLDAGGAALEEGGAALALEEGEAIRSMASFAARPAATILRSSSRLTHTSSTFP